MSDKRPVGPPPHVPSAESKAKVVGFVCAGFTQSEIANYFDMDEKTLRKHYREELDKAKLETITKLSNNVYKMALEGNEKMAEFVLKCQGRWSYYKSPEEKSKTDTLLEKLIDKL